MASDIDECSKSQSASDTAYLKSSANLGSRLQHTAEDRIALSEHLAVKSAMKKSGNRSGHAESVDDQSQGDSEVSDDSHDEISQPTAKSVPTKEQERIISTKKKAAVAEDKAPAQQPTQKPAESTLGSALGSALGAGGVTPVIRPRKKKTKTIPVSYSPLRLYNS